MKPSRTFQNCFAFFIFVIFSCLSISVAPAAEESHVTAALVSEYQSIQPGQPFWVGLHLNAEPGWHTYYKDPGEAGFATQIQWHLPEGWVAGPIVWPAPKTFYTDSIKSFGYEGSVLLLTQITPSQTSEGVITLKAAAKWLSCKDICLPGKADLELTLPIESGAAKASSSKALFDSARKSLIPTKRSAQKVSPPFILGMAIGGLVLAVIASRVVKNRHAD